MTSDALSQAAAVLIHHVSSRRVRFHPSELPLRYPLLRERPKQSSYQVVATHPISAPEAPPGAPTGPAAEEVPSPTSVSVEIQSGLPPPSPTGVRRFSDDKNEVDNVKVVHIKHMPVNSATLKQSCILQGGWSTKADEGGHAAPDSRIPRTTKTLDEISDVHIHTIHEPSGTSARHCYALPAFIVFGCRHFAFCNMALSLFWERSYVSTRKISYGSSRKKALDNFSSRVSAEELCANHYGIVFVC
ncbi:unnamed protein product [Prorocentrum cordatum]|uniref:Uncharacterized protein n=1 Tax=Prorocentrum cordatum TaxID=2364126 RepID=A0ABN9TAW5_9DINO|nr:unnamed protein product [Polarella glacialis]